MSSIKKFENGQILRADDLNSIVNLSWYNKLRGKRISIVGDSISTFAGYVYSGNATQYPDGNVATVEDTYWKQLIDATGMVLGVNNAYAGYNTKSTCTDAMISRLNENGEPDIILVAIGTNEYYQSGSSTTVGELDATVPLPLTDSEVSALPSSTFAEAYRTLLIKLQYHYPNAQIFCCSPIYAGHPNKYRFFDNPYIKLIEQYCDLYGVHYIDMRKCGITQINVNNYMLLNSGKIQGDYTHPNKEGHYLMFQYIYNCMLSSYNIPSYEEDNGNTDNGGDNNNSGEEVPVDVTWYTSATKDSSGTLPPAILGMNGSGYTYFNESTHDKYQGKTVNRIALVPSQAGTLSVYLLNGITASSGGTVIGQITMSAEDVDKYTIYEIPATNVATDKYIGIYQHGADTGLIKYWNVSSSYNNVTDQGQCLCTVSGDYLSSEKGACGFDLGYCAE